MDFELRYLKDVNYQAYLFHEGTNYRSHELLGAHEYIDGDYSGVSFVVWAPRAKEIYLVGDFNDWAEESIPMERIYGTGLWNVVVSDVKLYDTYKYRIITDRDEVKYKADPFAFHAEERPKTGSKYFKLDGFKWSDDKWIEEKEKIDLYNSPMNIYEVNILSWKKNICRRGDSLCEEEGLHSYRVDANHGTSLRRLMGLSSLRLFCAD